MRRAATPVVLVALLALAGGALLPAGDALADTAEPAITTLAWWWEEAQSEQIRDPTGNQITVDTPNPFCPGPGQGLGQVGVTCAEGRIPVEVHSGDYETPNKMSAVAFDLSLVPVGSKVSKFTATFLEARAGCYEEDDPDAPQQCEQTDPQNIEGKELRACEVTQIFGDGEARPYDEQPKFECADDAPVAKRKEITLKRGGEETTEHVWTFDLTEYAAQWTKDFSVNTSIMLMPQPPKEEPDSATQQADTWRVVLTGPKAPEGREGVKTKIVFEPAEVPPLTDTGGDGTTTTTTTGTDGGTGTGTVSTGGTDTGAITGDTTSPDAGAPSPGAELPAEAASEDLPEVEGMPAYVWLAILAGIVGFALVRSAVIEAATGARPDGVLARIHSLNAERQGGAAVAAATETPGLGARVAAGWGALSAGAGNLGKKIAGLPGKLRRGGS